MSGRERTQNKERFANWLLRQINSNQFEGVRWLDEDRTLFRLPWKHLNMRNVDERDYGIFKAWAIQSGKYNSECEDPPTWKTNFRCALNGVVYRERRMFSEIQDCSRDEHDPHKIYRFNGDHNDLPPSTIAAASVPMTAEQNLRHELEEEEEYMLHISPDSLLRYPFDDHDVIEELMRNIFLDSPENGIHQALQFSQDEQVVPFVNHVFENQQWPNSGLQEPCVNGHEQSVPYAAAIHTPFMHEQCAQHEGYNPYHNGLLQKAAAVNQVCQEPTALPPGGSILPSSQNNMYETRHGCTQDASDVDHTPMYSYHTPPEECAGSAPVSNIPPVVNGHGLTSSQEVQVNLFLQQMQIPHLKSWEVTISYRGREVLKQDVANDFFLTQSVGEAPLDPTDIVKFPTTDVLVDQLQIDYTEKILDSVGRGLFLQVNLEDYKVYATRMGKSRIYWGLSESMVTKENSAQAKMLPRDVPTEIFDFKQFWEDMKDYKYRNRSSPDYTIYMSFGQILFEPVVKKLVLVKLVPKFCTFMHQAAQREGASSLHTEVISLQISNGSSFNSSEIDGPCLMDLDFECLSYYLQD